MINIAIVDDEDVVVNRLKSYVDKFFEENRGGGADYKVTCFNDGVNFLSTSYGIYDIVFMDISMPIKNGMEVAEEFRKNNESACLIFVTNMASMAIKGYEVSALDFVIKPVLYSDFCYRLQKAIKRVRQRPQDFITVLNNRLVTKISIQSILYVEVVYHRLVYHTLSGNVEEWGSMSGAEERLAKYCFARCNSGYLVNLRYVESITGNEVKVGDTTLPISRKRRTEFVKQLTEYLWGSSL